MEYRFQAAREILSLAARGEKITLNHTFSFGRAALWSPLKMLMDLGAIDWSEDEVAFVKTPDLTSHKTVAILSHLQELEKCSQ